MRRVNVDSTLWTAADLLEAGSRLEHCELWDGRLLVREPSGGWHGPLGVAIAARLHAHVRGTRGGWVCDASTGYLVRRDPDRVLSPDVSYVSRERVRVFPAVGFVPVAPEFVVELKSPRDSWLATVEKCGVWIAHDVLVAWAVRPEAREVVEFRPGARPRRAHPGEAASAAPALPGFELPVSELFEDLEEGDAET